VLANLFRDRFEICPEIREQARSYGFGLAGLIYQGLQLAE
jgi:hypothetical protein